MDAPDKALLMANASISKKNSFTCMICIIEPKTRNWEIHIASRQHISLLEKFNIHFENLGEKVSCKKCKSLIAWKKVQKHARFHSIMPWYEPADKYKKLYDNHMMKFRTMYYCYLCDKIFAEWSSAYYHTDEKCHKDLKQQVPSSVPLKASAKMYANLLTFGFAPGKDDTIDCKMCNVNLTYCSITEHKFEDLHRENKPKFIKNLVDRIETEGFAGQTLDVMPKESTLGVPEVDSTKNQRPNRFLEPRGMICNFVIKPNVNTDEISENEEKSVKAMDENWFNKNFPKWNEPSCKKNAPVLEPQIVSDVELVHTPIKYIICSQDALSMEVMTNKSTKHKQRLQKKGEDFLDLCCVICSSLMSRNGPINDHLRGQQHARNRRKYGCDNITQTRDNEYYCKSCDYNMANFEDLYRHLTSKGHLTCLNSARMENGNDEAPSCQDTTPSYQDTTPSDQDTTPSDQDTTPFCQNSSPSYQDTTPSCQSSSCMFVVKRNAKKSFCQICDEKPHVFTKNVNVHITSQCHIIALKRYGCENIVPCENGTFHCLCCERDISDLENVYLHIKDKKHMSSMIKVSLKEVGSRKKIDQRSLTPEKNYQPLGNNLLSDYIIQQIATSSSGKIELEVFDAQRFKDVYRPDDIGKRNNPFYSFNRTPEVQSDIAKHSNDFPRSSFHNSIDVYAANRSTDAHPCNSIVPNIQKQPELSSILSSMASELTRLLEPFEANKRGLFSKDKKTSTFNGKQINKDKSPDNKNNLLVIYCPICSISLPDLTELHSHMAQHLSDEFVSNKRPRNHNNSPQQATENGHTESQMMTEVDSISTQVTINGNSCNNEYPIEALTNGTDSSTFPQTASDPKKIIIANPENDKRFPRPGTTPATFLKVDNDEKLQHSPRRANMKKVVQTLDFEKDFIYDMSEKLADLKLGLKLCLVIDSATIYCLVCRKTIGNAIKNYLEHLGSLDHCEYLEIMERDNSQFEKTPDEFSDLDLAQEYMEEINDNFVRCFICDEDIANIDNAIEQHIYDKIHERTCGQMRANAMANYDDLKSQIHCDWYNVQKYWCVPCLSYMDTEVDFVKHLESRRHVLKLRQPENDGKRMIFDFCQCCALLWYGYRQTWSYHCEISMHKWLSRDGHYMMNDLPILAKNLLNDSERFAEDKIKYLDEISRTEDEKVEMLIRDVENAARMKFSRAKAYKFGSRATGLGSPDSDIDVFLDCRNMYDGRESSESQVLYFMTGVHQCLSKNPQTWDVEELLTKCRSPIIRAFHRATELACDISFEHGLAVENTKLIKTFNCIYPSCRKLTLILKQWLTYCDLSGSERITSYALNWYVIFYLQKESILPSIATLIMMKNKSQIIAGWETGVSHDFTFEPDDHLSITELLTRFFTFYANFDFRFDVACPLLGEIVKKRDFVDPWNLPDKMQPYITYMKSQKNPVPFRIDSAMCIQDPFDLQHNLTKAVHKAYLNRFRTCCSKSLDLLWSLHKT